MPKFILQIGDNKVELTGHTREDAIKKAGLNPKHWQENRGANMEIKKEVKDINKKQPTVANTPKKKAGRPPRVETKPSNYRRKPNITTEDIGRWYTDGKDVWILDTFVPEPQVSMSKVASTPGDPEKHETKQGYLSDFKDFRRLIPEPESRRRPKKPG